jgi:beta-glucanase (GH16 family)
MNKFCGLVTILAVLFLLGREALPDGGASAGRKILLDPAVSGVEKRMKPSSGQVSVSREGDAMAVAIQPGKENYPGVAFGPEGAAGWDLSAFGHVEAKVVNTGEKPVAITLRVDNAGDWHHEPWNAETVYLKPKETGTVVVIFGHSYGRKPGYALDPRAVTNLLVFAGKSDVMQSLRIESIAAAGPAGEKPPVDPRSIRVKPKDGMLLGKGVEADAQKQVEAKNVRAEVVGTSLRLIFSGDKEEPIARWTPALGRWDLRDCLEIRLRLRNDGQTPILPRVRGESDGGQTDWIASAELAPGQSQEVVVPFVSGVPWQGIPNSGNRTSWQGVPGTGNRIANDAVSAVAVSANKPAKDAVLVVESIRAGLPSAPTLPEWLGRRPPVEGDWAKTFDEDFSGTAVDLSKWNNTGPNYWDKSSRWSKQNVMVGDGLARLRYEKRAGPHNDDPKAKQAAYTSGYLDTYGKWVQRYGYFEARMKLPAAPGLWPAFWMMPDRGEAANPQWKRQDTGDGGMEFDVMEHLTRWGPCRYNIAMHWDGYGDGHKQTGTTLVYVQPDREGFITSGLLWTPGKLVLYGNGREVARWEDPRVCSVPCDLMFTLPTGGWDNNRLDDAQLPADFAIDYVRVWQRRDLAGRAD